MIITSATGTSTTTTATATASTATAAAAVAVAQQGAAGMVFFPLLSLFNARDAVSRLELYILYLCIYYDTHIYLG